MADIDLTQSEADALIAMEKHRVDDTFYNFPDLGGFVTIPLISPDKKENFILDISKGKIDLQKVKYQNRARHILILLRLDMGGKPHRNPDDKEISGPHIHIYKEGYGDKWAYPIPLDKFKNIKDVFKTLEDFMRYCNITLPPNIQKGIFT